MSLLDIPAKTIAGIGGAVTSPIGAIGNFLKNPFSTKIDPIEGFKTDYMDGFIIREITQNPDDAQQVNLVGNMMPKDNMERELSLRSTKTMYPGNDDPTVQILGYEENDITIKGRLYDKRFTDKKFRGVANEIREQIEEMAKRKNLVRISLGEWRRYALINRVKTSERTLADIEYEITFLILGTKAPTNFQLVDRLQDIPIDVNNNLIAEATKFAQDYSSIPESVPVSIADIINTAVSSVAGVLKVVTDFIDDEISSGEDIVLSVNRGLGLVKYARGRVLNYRRRVGAITYSTAYTKLRVPQRYRVNAFIGNSMSQSLTLQQLLNQLIKRYEALSVTVPLSRHRLIVGDTLQKLSIKFYGTADQWKKIYDHNKLSSTDLTIGQVIEIPRL